MASSLNWLAIQRGLVVSFIQLDLAVSSGSQNFARLKACATSLNALQNIFYVVTDLKFGRKKMVPPTGIEPVFAP